jgi:cobalamin biosynthesis Mg chelatase CobN
VQIKAIDTQISALTGTVNDINSSVISKRQHFYKKQISMMLMLKVKKRRTKQKSRMYYALFAILAVIALFSIFYFIGKKKNNN